jgi:hypothetical protein
LEKIAKDGADAFYTGEIVQSMVNHCAKNGGVLSMKDLAGMAAVDCSLKWRVLSTRSGRTPHFDQHP